MAQIGEHAVASGAGMAGLLAARALSEFYHLVTVVERDKLADQPSERKGVPQGRHLHNFLAIICGSKVDVEAYHRWTRAVSTDGS